MSRVALACGVNSASAASDSRQQMDFCMNKRMGRFPALSLGEMMMANTGIFIRRHTRESAAIESGANASKRFTPHRSDHGFVRIGSGKNWTVPIVLTRCS
jgi:hypothetical protein